MPPPSQQDRRDATRATLIKAGRRLFAERGFAGSPADDIVAAAGVTRGALHHHFDDKRGLFRAVFQELEADIAHELASVVSKGDGNLLRLALSAFLDICERPEVIRIALTDAPAVLGWRAWREIEFQYGLGLLSALLEKNSRENPAISPGLLAQLLLGSVIEAALIIAHADDPRKARMQVEASLAELFVGLMP